MTQKSLTAKEHESGQNLILVLTVLITDFHDCTGSQNFTKTQPKHNRSLLNRNSSNFIQSK